MEAPNKQVDRKLSWLARMSIIFLGLGVLGLWLDIFLDGWKSVISPVTWNISDRASNRYQIKTITIDSNSDPWFVAKKRFGAETYELRHVKDEQVDTWPLPSLTYEEVMFMSATNDKTGRPWLILGERLAR